MNLHKIVRGAINRINPDVQGSWQASTGYTTAATGKRSPGYAAAVTITVQEQALTAKELAHLNSMNIGGVLRGFWADGDIQSVDHSQTPPAGGDLLTVPSGTYLIVQVFETWSQSGWCHCAGQRQKT